MTTDFEIGKVYTFNVYGASVLGATIYKNMKLISILDYTTAKVVEPIDVSYRAIYPLLPVGTPDQPESCLYYRFTSMDSGESAIFANQWIDTNTVELIENINFQVTIEGASLKDMTRVRNAISQLGFTNFSIKQI